MSADIQRWRGALALLSIVAIAALSACLPIPDPHLRWPPPLGWEDFTVVQIGAAGGTVRLSDERDYRLVAPEVVTGPVEVVGGHHVVWVGGHIRIEDAGLVHHGKRRGLTVRDDGGETAGRIVHVEGLLLDGDDLTEGIDLDAPTAVVQLANIRVEEVAFRSADDRDGTGEYEAVGPNHPDVVQTYGGFRELRIDGLSAASAYQGLFLKIDHDDAPPRPIHLRRVDVRATVRVGTDGLPYAGNRMLFWDVDTVGDLFVETGTVWVQHNPDAGKVAAARNPRPGSGSWWHGAYREGTVLSLEPPPGTAVASDAVEQRQSITNTLSRPPEEGVDADGATLGWDGPAGLADAELLDAAGTGPGSIRAGVPPGGPYVPAALAGLDYVSPGYQD